MRSSATAAVGVAERGPGPGHLIAAVPTSMVEDVALIGPWAKIADEIQRWRRTVLTTFSVSTGLRHLEAVVELLRG